MAYFPYVTLASGISINSCLFNRLFDKFLPVLKMADEFKVCGVERRRHLQFLRATRKCCLLVSACCFVVIVKT